MTAAPGSDEPTRTTPDPVGPTDPVEPTGPIEPTDPAIGPGVLPDLEPADLDGHTIDELADYLDAGMTPTDPDIEQSAACQNALAAIVRLRRASAEALADAVRDEPEPEESWIGGILANISLEARAGRDIPYASTDPAERSAVTEGAVRALTRSAGDGVPGAVVARVALHGDVDTLGAPVVVDIDIAVTAGNPLRAVADRVRSAVLDALGTHTDLLVDAVDIRVRDLVVPGGRRSA